MGLPVGRQGYGEVGIWGAGDVGLPSLREEILSADRDVGYYVNRLRETAEIEFLVEGDDA